MADDPPSMDEILDRGRARERRTQIVLGVLIVAGGLAFRLGVDSLGSGVSISTFGAIGIGLSLIGQGLFARR